MSGLYYATNSGAILRRLFPKQLNTPASILFWTFILIINITVVVCVHCFVFYPISDFSRESLQEHDYFKESKILLVEEHGDYYVTYENVEGEKRVAHLKMFPSRLFERASIDKDYDCIAKADGTIEYVDDSTHGFLFMGHTLEVLAGIYIAISVLLLLFEFFLFNVFHRLFRE